KEIGPNAGRMGVCWRCVESESIIETGLDMNDKGLANDSVPAKSAMDKLRLLLKRHCMTKNGCY
ncbi:MAG: hypothetical protein KAR42_17770, partial [candidate division Zixibacteria bacterium]|nr:hypothetical protein [candidate division Zixibacteria bacterium]